MISTGSGKKDRLYDRCMYRDCRNGRISTGSHLYRFPKADDPRHDVWIQYTANPRLKNWSATSLRNAGLCSSHFRPSDFNKKGKLRCNAIPVPFFTPEEVQDGDATIPSHSPSTSPNFSSSSVQVEEFHAPKETEQSTTAAITACNQAVELKHGEKMDLSFDANMTSTTRKYGEANLSFEESDDELISWITSEPYSTKTSIDHVPVKQERYKRHLKCLNNTALVQKLEAYRKQIRLLNLRLKRALNRNAILKIKNKKKTVDEFLDERNCTEPAARAMIKLQLHHKNAPYADDEKELAKQLFHYSAITYKRLQKAGCNFPSISAVRAWLSEINIKPGFCPDIVDQ